MEQLCLVPNLNLRRLIKDLLSEGGEGLYVFRSDGDESDTEEQAGDGGREFDGRRGERPRGYRFALVAEHILVLKVGRLCYSDVDQCSFCLSSFSFLRHEGWR